MREVIFEAAPLDNWTPECIYVYKLGPAGLPQVWELEIATPRGGSDPSGQIPPAPVYELRRLGSGEADDGSPVDAKS